MSRSTTDALNWLELKIPPPLVALLSGGLIWWLAQQLPENWALPFNSLYLAMAIAGVGLAFDLAALLAFVRARTTINPLQPANSRALVTSGVYRYTRNPMYLGLVFVLCGWTLYLGQWLLLPLAGLVALYLTRFQIIPEERILIPLFGEEYRTWMRQVRRWL